MSNRNEQKTSNEEFSRLQEEYKKKFDDIADTFYFCNIDRASDAIRKALKTGKPIKYDIPKDAII